VTVSSKPVEGILVSEITLLEEVREVPVPFNGSEYICPACEQSIPTRKQIRLSKPARWEGALNDVFKCPYCNFLFSPRSVAHVIRQ
jgi:DNA-directed RNA polymerase subunit RPC12/RpoP